MSFNYKQLCLQSDQIYDAVRAFKWYKLPQNEWKNYLVQLHYAQQPQRLYIGGIKPLNMETCVSVSHWMYANVSLHYNPFRFVADHERHLLICNGPKFIDQQMSADRSRQLIGHRETKATAEAVKKYVLSLAICSHRIIVVDRSLLS